MLIDHSNPDRLLTGHLMTNLQASVIYPQLPSTEYFKEDNFQ
jgi:hypothetical protein